MTARAPCRANKVQYDTVHSVVRCDMRRPLLTNRDIISKTNMLWPYIVIIHSDITVMFGKYDTFHW